MRSLRSKVFLTLLVFGVICGMAFLPSPPEPQSQQAPFSASGGIQNATTSLAAIPTCGRPTEVLRQFGFSLEQTPSGSQLMLLPRPDPSQPLQAGKREITYDPTKDEMCVLNAQTLSSRSGSPTSSPLTSITPDTSVGSPRWFGELLTGILRFFTESAIEILQSTIDFFEGFGFLLITPHNLTYDHKIVRNLHGWIVGMVGGMLALILVIAGYAEMIGHSRGLRLLAPRLVLAAVFAIFSLDVLKPCIELQNELCRSLQMVLATAGVGDLSLSSLTGVLNFVNSLTYELVLYSVELVMILLLCLMNLARLSLLDFLLVTAPFGALCLALPSTAAWGRLWAQAFVATLMTQFFQLLCIGMGSAFIGGFLRASWTPVTMLAGITTLFVALKLPGLLLTNVLRASVSSVSQHAAQFAGMVSRVVAFVKA
jgi:hypothetical protein